MTIQFGQNGSFGALWTFSGSATIVTGTGAQMTGLSLSQAPAAGQAVTLSSSTASITNGTYFVSTTPAPTTSAFGVSSTHANALAGTNVNVTSGGTGTIAASQTTSAGPSSGWSVISPPYTCSAACTITGIGFQSTSGTPTTLSFGLYSGTWSSATLVAQTGPLTNVGGTNVYALTSSYAAAAGTYILVAVPQNGYIGIEIQNGGYFYTGNAASGAAINYGGAYVTSGGGPYLVNPLPALSGNVAEFIIWADGTVGPTYYPLSRRRRTFIPIVFPR